ncbi:hypothetical protein JCM8097_006108 [Rhodosporidiobolus ruineniae]
MEGTIAATRPRRQRRTRNLAEADDEDYGGGGSGGGERDEGGGGGRRLKVRVGQGGHGNNPVDSVGWDRELDSDLDEPLAVEEQFILRVPPSIAPKLKEAVDKRDIPADVWFKFKDSRRAVFHQGDKSYAAKLVDLPALLESQRLTGVGGQTVKVADVSQMLVVEEEIRDEAQATRGVFNIEDFQYPHGITPPLKHVRKRRFRQRVNRRTIEQVEAAVEKLLEADARAEKVEFAMLDYDVPSDDENYEPGQDRGRDDWGSVDAPTPRADGGVSSPAPFGEDGDSQRGGDDDEDESDDDDEDDDTFAAELLAQMQAGAEGGSKPGNGGGGTDDSDDDGGLFGSSDDDEEEEEVVAVDDDPETAEAKKRLKLLAEEMADLDKAIASKQLELNRAANPIFKKRFEDQIKKFHTDRDLKQSQHTAIARELDQKREAAAAAATAEAGVPHSANQVAAQAAAGGTPGGAGGDAMDLS